MSRKVKLIFNPIADLGRAWRLAADLRPIVEDFGGADWSGTVYPTHATELARQAGEQGYDMVIAMGGDGTVHEIVNGLMQVPVRKRPSLGIVPLGSGNDFAHALGVSSNPPQALRQAFENRPQPIDLGLLKDDHGHAEYFDNTLGIGFDAVVTIRSRKITFIHGFAMYFLAVLQTIILNFNPMQLHVQTDSETWDLSTLMLTLCNGPREGGGFFVAPEARFDDGLLHYATVRSVSRLMMFRLIPEVMKGTHGRFKQVRMGTCRKLSLTSDRPLYIHADGEIFSGFGSSLRGLSIEILPEAMQVVRG
jgi:YegS/Rv2252/BmrU family lipid kinase